MEDDLGSKLVSLSYIPVWSSYFVEAGVSPSCKEAVELD